MVAYRIQLHDINRRTRPCIWTFTSAAHYLDTLRPNCIPWCCMASASPTTRLNAERTLPVASALFQTPPAPHCTYLHMLLSLVASVGRTSTSSAQSSRKMVPKGPLQSTKPMDLPSLGAGPGDFGLSGLISIVPEKMAALPSLNLCKAAKPQSTKKKKEKHQS